MNKILTVILAFSFFLFPSCNQIKWYSSESSTYKRKPGEVSEEIFVGFENKFRSKNDKAILEWFPSEYMPCQVESTYNKYLSKKVKNKWVISEINDCGEHEISIRVDELGDSVVFSMGNASPVKFQIFVEPLSDDFSTEILSNNRELKVSFNDFEAKKLVVITDSVHYQKSPFEPPMIEYLVIIGSEDFLDRNIKNSLSLSDQEIDYIIEFKKMLYRPCSFFTSKNEENDGIVRVLTGDSKEGQVFYHVD